MRVVNEVSVGRESYAKRLWLKGIASAMLLVAAPEQLNAHIKPCEEPETVQIDDLAIAFAHAEQSKASKDGRRVLLVLDLDNTLLRMPQRLGDDAWFNYHENALEKKESETPPLFADFASLLAAQALLFSASEMEMTQTTTAELVAQASNMGVDIFILTARGLDLYDVTIREISRSGIAYDAPHVCAFHLCASGGIYGDEAIRSAVETIGETPQDAPYRPIIIRDGLAMVAGQNKGLMLELLMSGIGDERYDEVVFVDDAKHNVQAVSQHDYPVPVKSYHYTRWNGEITADEVETTSRQYRQIKDVLCRSLDAEIC